MWVFPFLLVGLAWGVGLFIDLTGDSGLYAAIARQMTTSGDWLSLKINGEPYYQKPHLFMWLAGLGIELFGHSNAAFKLFPFLAGLSSFWFTYRLGRIVFSENAGRLAALGTGTTQLFFLYFLDIHTDTVLQACVALGLWQIVAYLKTQNPLSFFTAFLGIGLAMLTKGPLGAVLPIFAILIYLLLSRDSLQLFHPKWFLGIGIILGVISPAIYHLYEYFGWSGIRFYFIDNNLGRVTGEVAGSNTDPFFYLYNLVWALLPWTAFVAAGLWLEFTSWFDSGRRNNMAAALLGSVLFLLVVFSISRGKAPNYLMILIPPLFVVASGRMVHFASTKRKNPEWLVKWHLLFVAIMGILGVAVAFLLLEKHYIIFTGLVVFSGVVSFVFFQCEKDFWKRILFITLVVAGAFNLFLNALIIPNLFRYQGARQALEKFEANKKPGDKLYNLHLEEYELFFYALEPVIQIHSSDDYYRMLKDKGAWVYTTPEGYKGIMDNIEVADTVFEIRQQGMNALNPGFLNPETRYENLSTSYLLRLN